MSRILRSLILSVAFLCCAAVTADSATACPMCKTANETDDALPRAYMYSILFMLSMPAMMVSGFGLAFYRLSRRTRLQQEAALAAESQSLDDASGDTSSSTDVDQNT